MASSAPKTGGRKKVAFAAEVAPASPTPPSPKSPSRSPPTTPTSGRRSKAPEKIVRTPGNVRAAPPSPGSSAKKARPVKTPTPSKATATRVRIPNNPHKTVDYEFFGPVGVSVIMVALPVVAYLLYAFCPDDQGCSLVPPLFNYYELVAFLSKQSYFSWDAVLAVAGWLFLQVLVYRVMPGETVKGLPLEDGYQYTYRLNGLASMLLFTIGVAAAQWYDWIDLAFIPEHFVELMTVIFAISLALSIYSYLYSFLPGARLAVTGNTGNAVYDFWMGRAYAPFLGNVDIKFFCEQRPGLMAWCLFNAGFAIQQYRQTGSLTNSMILVNVFHYLYVLDTFVFERAVLSTADITTEGFGYMLSFGDLFWVPIVYSQQARYLMMYPVHLSWAAVVLITAVFTVGYVIFRQSNLDKDRFRRNPDAPEVRHLKYMKTHTGSRLIVSGWWGMARHINYFGDWLLSLAGCLACGFNHVLPYFFVVYFGVLLVHRERRDDHKCRSKYKESWTAYTTKVPWRIIPYVY